MSQPLQHLSELLAPDMRAVNALIIQHIGSDVPMARQIAQSLINAGGKRIRPLLTLAFGKLMRADDEQVRMMAAAVEFIHSATLLHDDVVDESELRRGLPSANAQFGNAAPILVGDFLFARAFEMMVQADNMNALALLARTASAIAQGEVLQLSVKNSLTSGRAIYYKIIEAKTAVLFAASTEVPSVLSGKSTEGPRAYGLNLGMAFQIMDDVLDYTAAQPRLGKTIGDDFAEGKVTLPVWLALENATAQEKEFWHRTMATRDQRDGDLAQAMTTLARHDAFDLSIAQARRYAHEAREALREVPSGELRETLAEVVSYVVARSF